MIQLRKRMKMLHSPTLKGDGKWESKKCYIRYKLKRHKLNNIAEESRKRNR